MVEKQEHELVKILYVIPEDEGEDEGDAGETESLWAYSLGNQLYELQNIPIFAEHLNVEDIVFCDELPDSIPVIKNLVKPSGNRTLRVVFTDEAPDDDCVDIIWELAQRKILYEKVAQKRYMFNIGPDDNYEWAFNFLRTKEEIGLLFLYDND